MCHDRAPGGHGLSAVVSRSTTAAKPAPTSSPTLLLRRPGHERRSRSAHQSFDHQGLWADLLSSEALAFNLFGDLASDLERSDRAAHAWWPDAPGTVREVRFAHSPGRLDPAFLNSLRAFDAAFGLDVGDGSQGLVGIDVKYHERAKSEIPKPENVGRYVEVGERSGVFEPGAIEAVNGRCRSAPSGSDRGGQRRGRTRPAPRPD